MLFLFHNYYRCIILEMQEIKILLLLQKEKDCDKINTSRV